MPGKVQSHFRLRHTVCVCLAALSLSACSLSSKEIEFDPHHSAMEAIDAATGPLEDLNLRKRDIPPLLLQAAADPYAKPKKAKCDVVRTEVAQLDELLGPDLKPREVELASADGSIMGFSDVDVPSSSSLMNSAGSMVQDKLLSTIRGHTNIIPLRSIVRKITGAERHQRHLAEAYEAGKLRRAYLKGYAMERFGKKCLAKPMIVEVKDKDKEAAIEAEKSAEIALKADPNEL